MYNSAASRMSLSYENILTAHAMNSISAWVDISSRLLRTVVYSSIDDIMADMIIIT